MELDLDNHHIVNCATCLWPVPFGYRASNRVDSCFAPPSQRAHNDSSIQRASHEENLSGTDCSWIVPLAQRLSLRLHEIWLYETHFGECYANQSCLNSSAAQRGTKTTTLRSELEVTCSATQPKVCLYEFGALVQSRSTKMPLQKPNRIETPKPRILVVYGARRHCRLSTHNYPNITRSVHHRNP